MKVLTCLFLFLLTAQAVQAQNQSIATATANIKNDPITGTPEEDEIDWANFENELENLPKEAWSFQQNKAGNLLYIDFEILGSKMERMTLQSTQNKTILMADNHLFDLPINTIYELNLEKLPLGTYLVELYTITGDIIQKEIVVQ